MGVKPAQVRILYPPPRKAKATRQAGIRVLTYGSPQEDFVNSRILYPPQEAGIIRCIGGVREWLIERLAKP